MLAVTLLVLGTAAGSGNPPAPGPTYPPPPAQPASPPLPVEHPAAAVKGLLPNPAENLSFQAACPGVEVQPFQRQPKATPVGPCQSDKGTAPRWSTGNTWYKEFPAAARFTLPRFDQRRQLMEGTNGLVIYEGMRLTVDDESGTYDVSLTATVPGMPATVHLQLIFRRSTPMATYTDPLTHSPEVFRLTLPPIRLEPDRNARPGDPSAFTFHINHRGYSSLFLKRNADLPPIDGANWTVTRVGTARFGTPTAVDDTFR